MKEETLKILEEYKQVLIQEFQEYVKICSDNAKWKLDYYKKHKDELDEIMSFCPQTLDLAGYYAYDNAKDIVTDKFIELLKKYEDTD